MAMLRICPERAMACDAAHGFASHCALGADSQRSRACARAEWSIPTPGRLAHPCSLGCRWPGWQLRSVCPPFLQAG
eukprot:15112610-Alexandrium_andersonii.AAC.1